MKQKVTVFEELNCYMKPLIRLYSILGRKAYYLRLSPESSGASWIKQYIQKGFIAKLDGAHDLSSTAIGYYADPAYANIEKLASLILSNDLAVRILVRLYEDKKVYDVFKKGLLDYLQRFYYINFITRKIEDFFPEGKILFVQSLEKFRYRGSILGSGEYKRLYSLIKKNGALFYETKRIVFPWWFRLLSFFDKSRRYINIVISITGFMLFSFFIGLFNFLKPKAGSFKKYKFAVLITDERLFNNRIQKIDFLIDGEYIKKEDTLFIYWKKLKKASRSYLMQNGLNFTDNLACGISLKNSLKAIKYAFLALAAAPFYINKIFALESFRLAVVSFAMWKSFVDQYRIGNLVSYCDSSAHSIARNMTFSQAQTKTWYYLHSVNWNNVFISPERTNFPLYSHLIGFLFYDYCITWSQDSIDYFRMHHQDIKKYISVGCLWSSHIKEIEDGRIKSDLFLSIAQKGFNSSHRLVSVFDSTYVDDSITTYDDGLLFLEGICRLLDDIPSLFIIFKEKTPREVIRRYSQKMFEGLGKLERHPRCYMPQSSMSPSEPIALSELVVSFPFTSATVEALGARKKALYYDAADKFRGSFYDKVPGLVCHNYKELLYRVEELLFSTDREKYGLYLEKSIKANIEPYLDAKALTRFRELLAKEA